jgi:hypothetical protein
MGDSSTDKETPMFPRLSYAYYEYATPYVHRWPGQPETKYRGKYRGARKAAFKAKHSKVK